MTNTTNTKKCNCRKSNCPLNGSCISNKCVIYEAKVAGPSDETKNYIGLTECPFKTRYTGHKQSFNHESKKLSTTLSKYVWDNNLQPNPDISFRILKNVRPYVPGARDCDLCLSEKLAILRVERDTSYLNKRSELKKMCPHQQKHTLKNT